MPNRVFIPQATLDEWLAEGSADLRATELRLDPEGWRLRLVEAVRVMREVTGAADLYDIVGRVKSASFLAELGAELLGASMIIGSLAYEVVPGFLVTPVSGSRSLPPGPGGAAARAPTEADLIARFRVRPLG